MQVEGNRCGKLKRRHCDANYILDQFDVFNSSTQLQDQELARKLFDALVSIDSDTARKVAEFHSSIIRRPQSIGEGKSGKWNLVDEQGNQSLGFLSLKPNYNGSMMFLDEEMGNVYCEVSGLTKENFQTPNNIKLQLNTDQLGEISGQFSGLLTLQTNDNEWTNIRCHISISMEDMLPSFSSGQTGSGGEWEIFGMRCS